MKITRRKLFWIIPLLAVFIAYQLFCGICFYFARNDWNSDTRCRYNLAVVSQFLFDFKRENGTFPSCSSMEELAAMPGFPLRDLKNDATVAIEEFEYLGTRDVNLLLRGSSRMRRMYPLIWMRRRMVFTLDDNGEISAKLVP